MELRFEYACNDRAARLFVFADVGLIDPVLLGVRDMDKSTFEKLRDRLMSKGHVLNKAANVILPRTFHSTGSL
jgi:hypothetical protein